MKRFYCTICRKVKRVQKWPVNISTQFDEVPTNRVGTCNYHARTPVAKREHQADFASLQMTRGGR